MRPAQSVACGLHETLVIFRAIVLEHLQFCSTSRSAATSSPSDARPRQCGCWRGRAGAGGGRRRASASCHGGVANSILAVRRMPEVGISSRLVLDRDEMLASMSRVRRHARSRGIRAAAPASPPDRGWLRSTEPCASCLSHPNTCASFCREHPRRFRVPGCPVGKASAWGRNLTAMSSRGIAGLVGADGDQIARTLVARKNCLNWRTTLKWSSPTGCTSRADRLLDVDRRVVALVGEIARAQKWPSRIARAASAIGSCWSSPSANTV